jgi:hypothetical protein
MYQPIFGVVNKYLLVHNRGMEKPKRGPGRPPVENGERLYLTIRISEARKALYELAAKGRGLTLSAWVKAVLDRASKR